MIQSNTDLSCRVVLPKRDVLAKLENKLLNSLEKCSMIMCENVKIVLLGGHGGLRIIQSKVKLSYIRMGPRSIISESLRTS